VITDPNAPTPNLGATTLSEIASQPECWARAQREAAAGVAGLPDHGERVLVLGCGTSFYVASAYAWLREQAGHGVTDALIASELPEVLRDYDRVIAISRSGTSAEVVEALTRVGSGTKVTAVLGELGTPVGDNADQVVDLSYADEVSVVQTRFPTTLLTLLRAHLGQAPAQAADLLQQVTAATADDPSEPMPRQLVVLGTGWAAALAQEAALKCRESAGMWAEAYATGEYRHGPISVACPGTLVWAMTPLTDVQVDAIESTGAEVHRGSDDPLVELVRLQRHAVAWAVSQGRDADKPVHLTRSVVLV
jgi:glucosamine--fructose-6-phosphate aminotransferase (isomerizing)